MRKNTKVWRYVLLCLIVICFFFYILRFLLPGMTDYLVIESSPKPSDVIIVLGGEVKGERTKLAVKLFQKGMAKKIIFSDGTDLSWRLKAVDEMVALAQQLGVPKTAIVKEQASQSTYENALYTRKLMEQNGWSSAIIVTTNWHLRRTSFIFGKIYANSNIALCYAGAPDPYHSSFEQWWKDGEREQVILTEWAKLIVYWLKYSL